MSNFTGNWKMKSSENFEELLKVLEVGLVPRKIAVQAASNPAVEIRQDGDNFYIRTATLVRTTEVTFHIGTQFLEQTVDGRPCRSLVRWVGDNKMECEQQLLKGNGPKTSWTRQLTPEGVLILTMSADNVICTRHYVRK